jgi:hypothetical protein
LIDPRRPTGAFRLETAEEQMLGISLTIRRRAATLRHVPAPSAAGHARDIVSVDPAELAAVPAADGA